MEKAVIVIGLGFGDEGKGSFTDFFVQERKASLVVRFSGGPQAAHNVINNGIHHTFSQFGSGTLSGASTHLSRYMVVEPTSLVRERKVLNDKGIYADYTVDPGCLIITPWHRVVNRWREDGRGANRHGSVGMGVGETMSDYLDGSPSITVGDSLLLSRPDFLDKIRSVRINQASKMGSLETFPLADEQFADSCEEAFYNRCSPSLDVLSRHDSVVFEGSQGILLDQKHGFNPHTTWSDLTFHNAMRLMDDLPLPEIERVGVLRTYMTRHGAGPFPTEFPSFMSPVEPESHNQTHPFMGTFRIGHFDAELARYAINCLPRLDSLAISHVDKIPSLKIADDYGPVMNDAGWLFSASPSYETFDTEGRFMNALCSKIGMEAKYLSYGPRAGDKRVMPTRRSFTYGNAKPLAESPVSR